MNVKAFFPRSVWRALSFLKKQFVMTLRISLALAVLCLVVVVGLPHAQAHQFSAGGGQETFPSPPSDQTLIYLAGEKNALTPLPFETGVTPLHVEMVATSDKRSYVEIKG